MSGPYRHLPLLSPVFRALRRTANTVRYAGERVHCPVCDRSFAGWVGSQSFGQCPYCASAARHRLIWLYLSRQLASTRGERGVLHVAPEWCLQRRLRDHERLRYVSVDAKAPNADVHADITRLPFADESFDLAVCSHVLEHVEDDVAAMRELRRVLRPGGSVLVLVPQAPVAETDEDPNVLDPRERARRFGQFDHVRCYGADVRERMASAGLEVREIFARTLCGADEAARYGLWGDVMFDCRKPAL
jgi:hypothetical protein